MYPMGQGRFRSSALQFQRRHQMDIISQIAPELNHIIGQLVQWIHSLVPSYGLAVILFTVFLKIITLPMDYWQRYSMRKTCSFRKNLNPLQIRLTVNMPSILRTANIRKISVLPPRKNKPFIKIRLFLVCRLFAHDNHDGNFPFYV